MTGTQFNRLDRDPRPLPVQEAVDGIFRITQTVRFLKSSFSVNVYVLSGRTGLVFDAGYGNRINREGLVSAIKQIESREAEKGTVCRISRAIPSHSHWDHFSGLDFLQKTPGLEVWATEDQARVIRSRRLYRKLFRAAHPFYRKAGPGLPWMGQFMKNQLGRFLFMTLLPIGFVSGPVQILEPGAVLDTGCDHWQVIDLPGHTDDDIALYCRERGVLLCGDILLRTVNTWLGPPRSSLEKYVKSLEIIRDLPGLSLILPAHGSPVTEPLVRIGQAIDHRHKRTRQIEELVRNSGSAGISYEQVCRAIYPTTPLFRRYIFEGWICVTLEHLVEKGSLSVRYSDRQAFFSSSLL